MKVYDFGLKDYDLRKLCIDNGWFTNGDNRQYEKLFKLCNEDAPGDVLAMVIWTCSEGVELDEIKATLRGASLWPIYTDCLRENLSKAGYGETEIEIICSAVETHPEAGTAYSIIKDS